MYPQLIIASHCDDAILSLEGTILRKRGFKVFTIFRTCAWSVIPELKDPKIITQINNKEETLAFQKANVCSVFGNEKEALLRNHYSWNAPIGYKKDRKLKGRMKRKIIKQM